MTIKTIEGQKYRFYINGNVSGTKRNAKKSAEKIRKHNYFARVLKSTKISGKAKDKHGKTTKVFWSTRFDVWIKAK